MSGNEPGNRGAIARFLLVFAGSFMVLQVAYLQAEGTRLERWLIDISTVRAAAALINGLDPLASVHADGPRLASPAASLNVLRGCEGTELYSLWIAAVLAFPAPWLTRLGAMAGGLGAAWMLNQLRIVALFSVVRDHRPWFALFHGYVAPALLVLLLGLGFAWYVRQIQPG
jgi:exosortase/archaeosortase family protein